MFPTSPLCGVRRCGSNGKQATLCPPLHWPTAENTPFCPGGCYTTPIFPHLWDSLSLLSNMDYSDSGTVSRVSCWMMTQATILPWTAHSWRRPPGCFHWPLLFIFIIVFFFFGFFKQVISRTFVWLRQRMSTGEESRRLDSFQFHLPRSNLHLRGSQLFEKKSRKRRATKVFCTSLYCIYKYPKLQATASAHWGIEHV